MIRASIYNRILSSSLSGSQLHTLVLLYRLCGTVGYIDASVTSLSKGSGTRGAIYSKATISRNLDTLEELGFITREGKRIKIRISDHEPGTEKYEKENFIKLNTPFIDKLLSCEKIKDNTTVFRFALILYYQIYNNFYANKKQSEKKFEGGCTKRKKPLRFFADELKCSTRTISRCIVILVRDIKLISYNKFSKNGMNTIYFFNIVSSFLGQNKTDAGKEEYLDYNHNMFLVNSVMRKTGVKSTEKDMEDTAELFTQYRKGMKNKGGEQKISETMTEYAKLNSDLNPKVINKIIKNIVNNTAVAYI